jgi:hypothetical protein
MERPGDEDALTAHERLVLDRLFEMMGQEPPGKPESAEELASARRIAAACGRSVLERYSQPRRRAARGR